MLRTIFTIGLFAVLGVVALGFLFNIFTALIGIAIFLLGLAIKIALVGLVIYVVIRIVSPETARRLRARWSSSGI
jgi:hypothetical protein